MRRDVNYSKHHFDTSRRSHWFFSWQLTIRTDKWSYVELLPFFKWFGHLSSTRIICNWRYPQPIVIQEDDEIVWSIWKIMIVPISNSQNVTKKKWRWEFFLDLNYIGKDIENQACRIYPRKYFISFLKWQNLIRNLYYRRKTPKWTYWETEIVT